MKKYIMNKAWAFIVGALLLASCYPEQEVETPMDPTTKPVVTITRTDGGSTTTVTEGDTLKFDITISKMNSQITVDFTPEFEEATGLTEDDYEVVGGSLSTFSTSTSLMIVVINDGFPEVTETMSFDLGAHNVGQSWQLSPESDVNTQNLQIVNVNEEGVITVALSWVDPDHDIDLDLYIRTPSGSWGSSAGSDNPEISTDLWPTDPNNTYYIGFEPWDVPSGEADYTLSIGFEDGTVQVFNGHYSEANYDLYDADGGYSLRIAEIVLLDGVATVTFIGDPE